MKNPQTLRKTSFCYVYFSLFKSGGKKTFKQMSVFRKDTAEGSKLVGKTL